ncbi:MAG: putative HD phosphohydrolase [Planctomycetota bacterium]|jgi:predicted HD phosphohydrolase
MRQTQSDDDQPVQTVSFTCMSEGTVQDFRIIAANDRASMADLPQRLSSLLRMLADDDGAYQISRLEHVLQAATRAERDGADDDWVVGCLLHDVGDVIAPHAHGEVAAEMLRPYVRPEVSWVVQHHPIFQRYYDKSLSDEVRSQRDGFRGHEHFKSTLAFCQDWDQVSFDPAFDSLPLEHFEAALIRVFSREPFQADS